MADQAGRQGFVLVFLTQGSLYRDDLGAQERALLWFGSVDQNPFASEAPQRYFTVGVMKRLLAEYNARMLEVCARRRLTCVDVARELRATTDTYYDDVHFNTGGSRRLGELLVPVVTGLIETR